MRNPSFPKYVAGLTTVVSLLVCGQVFAEAEFTYFIPHILDGKNKSQRDETIVANEFFLPVVTSRRMVRFS